MQWIKEVEIAKSIDDLMTSRSSTGRTDFPDVDMLDTMIASALKKLLTHVHFRKRVSVEEQRAQKYDRFLRGRHNAYMICKYFRAIGACEVVQGLSDLFHIRLHNDDVDDFDTRWDQALFSASEIPTEMILVGFFKSKLQDSVQLQTVLAMYEQENVRSNGQTKLFQTEDSGRRHNDRVMRTRNFRARSEIVERGTVLVARKWIRTISGVFKYLVISNSNFVIVESVSK